MIHQLFWFFVFLASVLAYNPCVNALEPVDVYDGEGSSGFSYYGTSPESPDGRRLTYVVYEPDDTQELRICNRDLTGHRKLADINIGIHNGAKAFWIDNQRLAYDSEGLRVIDVNTGEPLYGPFPIRSETHNSVDNKIIFHGNVEDEWAIWELDCDSGKIRKITTVDAVKAAQKRLGTVVSDEITHIQPSPDGNRMLFRYGGGVDGRMGCIRTSDGSDMIVFPGEKPMHFLWYDNETVMGVNWRFKPEDHHPTDPSAFERAGKERWYQRYNLEGGVIETLAGTMTHGAGSPDQNWYVGETANYRKSPIRLALYRRGSTEPVAILMDHSFDEMTWQKRAHVNPSFSRDGKRVYFFRAVSQNRFKASYVDFSKLIANIQTFRKR
jgi:hypothetical protein